MQIDGIPGQYWAMALIQDGTGHWKPCGCYHLSKEDSNKAHTVLPILGIHWPTEIENGILYVPHEDELK